MEKLALVTGASEGIGRSFAIRLAKEGYAVTAVARNEARLRTLMTELGGGHTYRVADLGSREGVAGIARALSEKHYDLLINNAGFAVYGAFHETELGRLHEMMRLNCDALVDLAHAFLKTARSGDALVNVSSTASFLPMPISCVYTASKSFVTSLSETLWYEQKKRGVYVLGLCPGITMTNFHERAGGKDEQIPRWAAETPDQVVRTAMKALRKRRKSVVISGPQKPVVRLLRFLPRQWTVRLIGRMVESGIGDAH